ncbi:MAG: hypothetical protein IT282_12245 [Bacteroidetes bacterium]|nr:hypothetical protein [Bacteroidota bacterium]
MHAQDAISVSTRAALAQELVAKHGEGNRVRIERGLDQVARLWQPADGDAEAFAAFVRAHYAGDQTTLDSMFFRFERLLEVLDGHMTAIGREFRVQADLDLGPILPFDEVFAGYDPSAHLADDFFANKLAFTVLLNFPLTTLEQRLTEGTGWTRRQWAEARLAQRFGKRIPASVNLAVARASAEADQYIAEYNIWMHHVLDENGGRPFPGGMRLLSHWNLRDQIKADYVGGSEGLKRQRLMQKVMEHIVLQTIPGAVVNNPHVDWNPFTNTVTASAVKDGEVPAKVSVLPSSAAEPDTRYEVLLNTFRAAKLVDPYSPAAPTLIARRFDENREIPEARFRAMLEQVVSSGAVQRVAKLIASRLGRPLEPFDIWYNGFRVKSQYTEEELDKIVAQKYPTPVAFEKDIPHILMKLGFTRERAMYLADHIQVDPARGSGHAMGAGMRADKVHLRTRIEKSGMNYKGFNIAVHELGHNVEQIISLHDVDHILLQGVPNTAFTEAIAFVFQAQDLALLGLHKDDPQGEALKALNDFWATYEIAGVALVDMAVWHWMYDHPSATPAQLKEATLAIAKDTWNRYYAPVFGRKDVVLLGIYSHMIHSYLYLPDYPLGHLIAHQVEEHIRKAGNIAAEVERMTSFGSVAPDLWMRHAVGTPVGAGALIQSAEHALEVVR